MFRISKAPLLVFSLPLFSVALLMAADPPWKAKPSARWSEEDAKQVLSASPWSKDVVAGIARPMSEDELRAGGEMGEHHGVGYDGVVGNKPQNGQLPKSVPDLLFGKGPDPSKSRFKTGKTTVTIRWESALPVQIAELKAGENAPPMLEGDGYRIVVYGVPGIDFNKDPEKLGEPLKNEAFLRREGKKDVKPLRVEVFQWTYGLAVAYLFPLSAELNKKDGMVEFNAHIGRVVVVHSFDLTQMEFQGKLEL
jgi:hypothetical protein